MLTVQPVIAAQLDLYTAMREQGISRADLAERQGVSSDAVDKLLSLDYSHAHWRGDASAARSGLRAVSGGTGGLIVRA